MWIGCQCGETIYDQTDYLPHKARFIPDQEWCKMLEAIDEAIEQSGPSAKEKEEACMKLHALISKLTRSAWQCSACGRVYIDDRTYQLRQFAPDAEDCPKELFRSRPAMGL